MKKFQSDPNTTTLTTAKQWLRSNFDEGEISACPCCGQAVKLYKRKMNKGMASALLRVHQLLKKAGGAWLHVNGLSELEKSQLSHMEFQKLRWWKVIEESPAERGSWRITPLGVDFINGRVQVRKYIYLFDDRPAKDVKNMDTTTTSITEAFGEKFDLQELMSSL